MGCSFNDNPEYRANALQRYIDSIKEMTHEQAFALELLKDWHHNPTTENEANLYNIATKLFGNPPKK